MAEPLHVATAGGRPVGVLPALANRHGLIAGATGTGKTVTLQVLAERFSAIGVPVLLVDLKGDLSGLAVPGSPTPRLRARLEALGIPEPAWSGFPVTFWDVYGAQGLPVRATVAELGPLLLARLLGLSEAQQGVLTVAFRVADEAGLPLLDLKDLQAVVTFVGEQAPALRARYGNVAPGSVGAVQRGLLALEEQGAEAFFGEPSLAVRDLLRVEDGRGVVNILAANRLLGAPDLYGAVLLFLLAELFEELPEVGDPEQPRIVVFFEEAALLFRDAPRAVIERVEQVVRLIRSRGVGVFFVTQSPLDLPEAVLGQLGNRVQHALRAFTPKDEAALRAVARTMRPNPAFDTAAAIRDCGVGEAVVSFLDAAGSPAPAERVAILPPASRIGPIDPAERRALWEGSPLAAAYVPAVDRESAYELLQARLGGGAPPAEPAGGRPSPAGRGGGLLDQLRDVLFGSTGPRGGRRDGLLDAAVKSAARIAGREIVRGMLGTLAGSAARRRR